MKKMCRNQKHNTNCISGTKVSIFKQVGNSISIYANTKTITMCRDHLTPKQKCNDQNNAIIK